MKLIIHHNVIMYIISCSPLLQIVIVHQKIFPGSIQIIVSFTFSYFFFFHCQYISKRCISSSLWAMVRCLCEDQFIFDHHYDIHMNHVIEYHMVEETELGTKLPVFQFSFLFFLKCKWSSMNKIGKNFTCSVVCAFYVKWQKNCFISNVI